MARKNKTQYALLGLLSKRPLSGYDIKAIFAKKAEFYWSESNAQIYPTLKKLEGEGLVSSHLDNSCKREKRIYDITDKGKTLLMKWLHEPVQHCVYREELLLKLSLGQHLDNDEIEQWIEDYRIDVQSKLVLLGHITKHIDDNHQDMPDQPYLRMVYNFYEHQLNARLTWCDETLKQLKPS